MREYGCVCVLRLALGAGPDNLDGRFSSILLFGLYLGANFLYSLF